MTIRDARVLVVGESKSERAWIQQALSGVARLQTSQSPVAALKLVERESVDLVVWSVPPERDGADVRLGERLRREYPAIDLVLLTDDEQAGDLDDVDRVLRGGSGTLLRRTVQQVLARRVLQRENVRLEDRVRTADSCRVLIPCLDPGEVFPVVLDLLLELLSRRRGIALFTRMSPLGEALAFRGFSEDEVARLHAVLTEEKPLDPARYAGIDCGHVGPLHTMLRDAGVRLDSLLAVPIHGEGDDAGVVWLLDGGKPFSEDEIEQARTVAGYALAALRNSERYHNAKERAFLDDVTGIYNVRYLLSATENEIQRADRYDNPLSVLFLDLDRFKLVNDRHGHLVGSQTLRHLSELLLQCVRQVDTLARYGGDEFTILLVDTAHDPAMVIAERIRRTVEEHMFEAGRRRDLRLTISIGVASFPEHARARDELLDVADKAMYRAKSLGRNRVCSAVDL